MTQYLFKVCHPQMNSAPASERDGQKIQSAHLCRVDGHIKVLNICRNRSKVSPLWGESLSKCANFQLLGAAYPPRAPMEVKFHMAKRTHVPLGRAKFHVNRCKESPVWGENIFEVRVKTIPAGLPLHAILPVTKQISTACIVQWQD